MKEGCSSALKVGDFSKVMLWKLTQQNEYILFPTPN